MIIILFGLHAVQLTACQFQWHEQESVRVLQQVSPQFCCKNGVARGSSRARRPRTMNLCSFDARGGKHLHPPYVDRD